MYLRTLATRLYPILASDNAVELISPPGIGKSEFVRQFVEERRRITGKRIGLGIMMIANYTPIDLLGYMIPEDTLITNAEGATITVKRSVYTIPPWFLSEEGIPLNDYDEAYLFMDEYGQGEPDVKKLTAELLLGAQIGPWKLDKSKVFRIAASNRASDRSGVTKSMDHIINRRIELHIKPDWLSFDQWAMKGGVSPFFRLYAEKHIEVVFSGTMPKDQGPFCTPRSLVKFSRVMDAFSDENGHYPVGNEEEMAFLSEVGEGTVGAPAARSIMAFIKVQTETPAFELIVKDPAGCWLPERADAKMLTAYSCAHRVDVSNVAPVIQFMQRLSPDYATTFAKSAAKRDHRLMKSKEFLGWVSKNAALLNAIS